MENVLTSLLKRKYGTTKSSPVVFTEKDTLYTSFRKLADNIYKNGTWTQEDEKRAVDTMIRNRNNFPLGEKEIRWTNVKGAQCQADVSVQPLSESDRTFLGDRIDGKVGYITLVHKITSDEQKTTTKKTYVLLDPENKTGTKHGTFYYFAHKEVNEPTYMALGNMNRAIGYDKLQRDILIEFDSTEAPLGFERNHLEKFLSQLSSAEYSGKKHGRRFKKEFAGELTDEFLATLPRDESKIGGFMKEAPYVLKDGGVTHYLYPGNLKEERRKNHIIEFVQNYIQNTYDILLQSEYEKDIDKQTRASAWQTKKNINKETLEMMASTSLIKHFSYVEIDNDVDLKLFKQFEAEIERIHGVLPRAGDQVPELRLRKLGNHNALGLYVPSKHTIAVDFRDATDEIGGVGIQSFIHEYGHALDYGINDGKLLSMADDFKPIVSRYRENIQFQAAKSYVGKKAGYYGAPTEVFARAFELYVSEVGLKSALLKPKTKYDTQLEYKLFDQDMRIELTRYFDQEFSMLKPAILALSKAETLVQVEDKNKYEPKTEWHEPLKKETELAKWEQLSRAEQNEILLIYGNNVVNLKLVLAKFGLEDTANVFTGLNSPLLEAWVQRGKTELLEMTNTFNEQRTAWLAKYGDEHMMYIPESLWEVAEKLGLMTNYPKIEATTATERTSQKETAQVATTDIESVEIEKETTESTAETANDNSRLEQAKRKLTRLQKEYKAKLQTMFDHQALTNGQPMNDKRNGRSWLNRQEQIETSVRNLTKEIEDQEARVLKLEEQKEAKEHGLNKQGGLLMTIENIPRIKEEIAKYKARDSLYSGATIQKYEKQLEKLESLKKQATEAESHLSEQATALIASGEIKAWAKNPMLYFVKGLKKVALELTLDGTFKVAERYAPHTEEEQQQVAALLKGGIFVMEEQPERNEQNTLQPTEKQQLQERVNEQVEADFAEKEEIQTVSPVTTGSEEFIIDLQDKPFMYEVTTLFTDFKQEIEEALGEVPKSTEPFITRAEIEHLLTEHMDRMEAIIAQHTAALTEIKEPTNEQVQLATQKMKRAIKTVLRECKEKITSYLTTKKERAVLAVSDTLDDIRLGVKNELTYRILNMNTALKNFSNKIDQMVSFEVKEAPEINISEGVIETEAMNETKPLSQPENSAMEQSGTDQPIEQSTKKVNKQVESATEDQTPSGKEQSVGDKYQKHQFAKIKGLSQQLGYEISEKNRQDIAALSPAETKTLIQSLETKVLAQSKTIPDKEVGLEL
ncbi:LPD1 domain-containing protein [Enterococcus sp. DIV1420a]|uniref:LPD1 domain-containing protein n=1 Tax=Enterococcus sp. DIV1420a TaxID=2774672 RepID=UPI003F2985DB